MREVYVLMRDVGEYEDRDVSPVLATLDKDDADAWLAKARAFAWPGRLDIFDDEQDDCAPPWETADALRKVRTYGEPTYRLVTVRLMGGEA
jgi:hypothetical protein